MWDVCIIEIGTEVFASYKMSASSKYRGFVVTDYVLDKTFWEAEWAGDKYRYIIIGEEVCPTTGKNHWQMFVYFKNPRSVNATIKRFKPRHVEVMRATPKEAADYCKKEGKFHELGECPAQGERTDLEEIRGMIDRGVPTVDIAEHSFAKWCQYGKRFEEYRGLKEEKRMWKTRVVILHGPPGTGKSREAHTLENVASLTISGDVKCPFISGYNGEDNVLFDDFEPGLIDRAYILKLLDRYPMQINIKGGSRNWKPRNVIFTTNDNPQEWYGGDAAFQRRISEFRYMGYNEVVGEPDGAAKSSAPCLSIPAPLEHGTEQKWSIGNTEL